MKAWIKQTFSDPKGNPSFKRQFAAFLGLALIATIFKNLTGADTLAVLIGALTTGTVIEKFTKPSSNNEL